MAASITLKPIASVPINTSFPVSGSFAFTAHFSYVNNNGPERVFPDGSSFSTGATGSFVFNHPPFTAPGTYNIHVYEDTTDATTYAPVVITAK